MRKDEQEASSDIEEIDLEPATKKKETAVTATSKKNPIARSQQFKDEVKKRMKVAQQKSTLSDVSFAHRFNFLVILIYFICTRTQRTILLMKKKKKKRK